MTSKKNAYHPEPYWSEVAGRIADRQGRNVIAGDDEPYYRYKRRRFLQMLHSLDFAGKKVLEVGPGPGGNLSRVWTRQPAELHGADISQRMIDLASRHLTDPRIRLRKIDGKQLPYEDHYFDLAFTATVLQHNSDESMMKQLLGEICRVSNDEVVLFEKIDRKITGDALCKNRPVEYYAGICRTHGFELQEVEYINIYVSYLLAGFTRKVLNNSSRAEGEPLSPFSLRVQQWGLPLTKPLDKIFTAKKDVAKMVFRRTA